MNRNELMIIFIILTILGFILINLGLFFYVNDACDGFLSDLISSIGIVIFVVCWGSLFCFWVGVI